jgi:excinuclease ABC subunit C
MKLKEVISGLPCDPGVYIFKDPSGRILYVGKAKRLRDRVRSHFRAAGDVKHDDMISRVDSIDFIVTGSEVDALILEANLIRDRQPRFNVTLKDDKRYPYLKVTVREDYPRLILTRRVARDGCRYFGPYTDVKSLRRTMKLLRSVFPLRTCGDLEARQRMRKDCLSLHLGRCRGPCLFKISKEEYRRLVDDLLLFLSGKGASLVASLRESMEAASERREYERCALIRDRIAAVESVLSGRGAVDVRRPDMDALGLAREGADACVAVLKIRDGKVIDQERRFLESRGSASDAEIVAAFIEQRYLSGTAIPAALALPVSLERAEVIERWLRESRGSKVSLKVPLRGASRKLVEMARRNAAVALQGRGAPPADAEVALEELRSTLGLGSVPYVIDCYDISNTSGSNAVGSRVVFSGGLPDKGKYRKYGIKGAEGPDDTAMMAEVVGRSLGRRVREGEEPPDLILVDGGAGQVSAAVDALGRVGLETVPVIGLAKARELVYVPGRREPMALLRDSSALRLLQRLRDEAHRFGLAYHRSRRSAAQLGTILDRVSGVGPARRALLLREFGSAEAVAAAPEERIARLPGLGAVTAHRIKAALAALRGGGGRA